VALHLESWRGTVSPGPLGSDCEHEPPLSAFLHLNRTLYCCEDAAWWSKFSSAPPGQFVAEINRHRPTAIRSAHREGSNRVAMKALLPKFISPEPV
jgi:hypothetical protein